MSNAYSVEFSYALRQLVLGHFNFSGCLYEVIDSTLPGIFYVQLDQCPSNQKRLQLRRFSKILLKCVGVFNIQCVGFSSEATLPKSAEISYLILVLSLKGM